MMVDPRCVNERWKRGSGSKCKQGQTIPQPCHNILSAYRSASTTIRACPPAYVEKRCRDFMLLVATIQPQETSAERRINYIVCYISVGDKVTYSY